MSTLRRDSLGEITQPNEIRIYFILIEQNSHNRMEISGLSTDGLNWYLPSTARPGVGVAGLASSVVHGSVCFSRILGGFHLVLMAN